MATSRRTARFGPSSLTVGRRGCQRDPRAVMRWTSAALRPVQPLTTRRRACTNFRHGQNTLSPHGVSVAVPILSTSCGATPVDSATTRRAGTRARRTSTLGARIPRGMTAEETRPESVPHRSASFLGSRIKQRGDKRLASNSPRCPQLEGLRLGMTRTRAASPCLKCEHGRKCQWGRSLSAPLPTLSTRSTRLAVDCAGAVAMGDLCPHLRGTGAADP